MVLCMFSLIYITQWDTGFMVCGLPNKKSRLCQKFTSEQEEPVTIMKELRCQMRQLLRLYHSLQQSLLT